jgi:hypothetical protein
MHVEVKWCDFFQSSCLENRGENKVDNIKIGFREIGFEDAWLSELAGDPGLCRPRLKNL